MAGRTNVSSARNRWLTAVTLAEAVGYMIPASMGILLTKAGFTAEQVSYAVVLAGFGEGFLLGLGQAWAFPLPVRKLRYALLTSAGGGIVWASVMSAMRLAQLDVSMLRMVTAFVIAGFLGLLGIGTAQWLELRHHTDRAHRWILWTALAWVLALPMSFLPGPLVDESTPLAVHLVLWFLGGLLMAFVMALVTWQGARRLPAVKADLA